MDLHPTDWHSVVAAYLAGRTETKIGVIARDALGREFASMTTADWTRLAAILRRLGFRDRKIDGVRAWRPEPFEPIAQLQLI
jgi:hypothetical protein